MTIDEYVARYIEDSHFYDKETSPVEKYLVTAGMQAFAKSVYARSDQVMSKVPSFGQMAAPYKAKVKKSVDETIRLGAATFDSSQDTGFFLYGLVNGAIDVFPSDSLPDLCRDNITHVYDTVNDLFVDWDYDLEIDDIELSEDIQSMMQYPYGISFSCFFFTSQVFFADYDPYADGVYDETDQLNASIVFVN
jgi:hypothetical protein